MSWNFIVFLAYLNIRFPNICCHGHWSFIMSFFIFQWSFFLFCVLFQRPSALLLLLSSVSPLSDSLLFHDSIHSTFRGLTWVVSLSKDRQESTISNKKSGISFDTSLNGIKSPFTFCNSIWGSDTSLSHGNRPLNNSYKTIPKHKYQFSHLALSSCSGDAYQNVPSLIPVFVLRSSVLSIFAIPKSRKYGLTLLVIMMFLV